MKLHVVDGTFELFRCWFGAPKATNSDGLEVGAVRALLRTLLSLTQEEDCTHVGVAYDRVIESFRNDLFDGYKTGSGIEPELMGQFPLAEQATRALGLTVWPMVRYEADDALATAAARWAGDVEQVVICSPDKDLTQCVQGDRVVLRDRMRKNTLNEGGVKEKFGVGPASIADYLALVGDSADGIPGIPKWGAKSSAAILSAYGHIEQIPPRHEDWSVSIRGASGLSSSLETHRNSAMLYRTLATLITDVPLPQTLDELRWKGAHREQLSDLCDTLDDARFLERVPLFLTE